MSPIDSEARAYLDWLAAQGAPPVTDQTPDEARRANAERAPLLSGRPEPVRHIEDVVLGGRPCRVYHGAADAANAVALLYLHGGGWVVGDLQTHDSVCRALAARTPCTVFSLDYRLAPEHPFPAALEDGVAALDELLDSHKQVAVGGDSSGGNLAAVIARRRRDRVAAQLLIYPVTDCDLDTASYREAGSGYGLTRAGMEWYWHHYASDPEVRKHPDASPLRAGDVEGLPPALVITCGLDPLAGEGIAYVEKLRAAGNDVVHIHEADMIHGYIRLAGVIGRARQSWDACARFLKNYG